MDVWHGSSSYRLSSEESRHSTQLQLQAASKLDVLSTLSSNTWKVSPVAAPTPLAKERPDLHSSTRAKSSANTFDESKTDGGITDEECRDMEIEYILLPKLKREIRRADLTGDQVFLCCVPQPAVPVDQMYKMQESSDNDGLDPVRRKLLIPIHNWASLYDLENAEFRNLPSFRPWTDHRIRLDTEENPPWIHPYKVDPSQLEELGRQLDSLNRSGRMGPPTSPYGAGCLLVKKTNRRWRICVNYRALNTRISLAFDPIHTEYTEGFHNLFEDRPCQWVPPDRNP